MGRVPFAEEVGRTIVESSSGRTSSVVIRSGDVFVVWGLDGMGATYRGSYATLEAATNAAKTDFETWDETTRRLGRHCGWRFSSE